MMSYPIVSLVMSAKRTWINFSSVYFFIPVCEKGAKEGEKEEKSPEQQGRERKWKQVATGPKPPPGTLQQHSNK